MMVNVKLTTAEKTDSYPSMPDPEYPWGLKLCLNDDVLKKLGIVGLPAVGSPVTIEAKAYVSRRQATEEEGDDAEVEMSLELQITDIAVSGKGLVGKGLAGKIFG